MNRNGKSFTTQTGYSMVEMLVAMVIVPFGLMGVAKVQSNIMVAGAESKTRSEALFAAERKIEELRSFTNGTTYGAITSGSDSITASLGSNATLARTWTVTDSASPDYKTVVVDVGWTTSGNEAKSVSLTSYVSMANPVVSGQLVLADTTTYVPPPPNPVNNTNPSENPNTTPGSPSDPTANTDPLADPNPTGEPNPASYSITISGFVTYEGNGSKDWSVSINGSVCDSGINSSSYTCVVSEIPWGDTPTLNVSLESSGTICGTYTIDQSFSNSSNVSAQNFIHAQNAARCI